ncbi:MAG: hypothetical protein WCK82_05235 [Bacteroidota bacterium]
MQVPVEPNLDTPIPAQAQPDIGGSYTARAQIAGNTAMLLKELGMEDDVTEEDQAKAREMFSKMKVIDDKNDANKQTEPELKQAGIALALGGYINHYEKQVIQDKIQLRNIAINRLLEMSQSDDDKIAIKAVELIGKASDLFTERSEITITHQTSDELRAAIKERIRLLTQKPVEPQLNATETRLSQLKAQEEVVDVDVKEVK